MLHKDPARDDYVYHIEFNDIHDYGKHILNDFGGVYMGSQCDSKSESYYEDYCYTYIHVYNNLIRNAKSYLNKGVFVYSDTSSGRNAFENNLMYGSGGTAINHHCVSLPQVILNDFVYFFYFQGRDNLSKNNFIHRKRSSNHPQEYFFGGCEKSSPENPQSYTRSHNIFLMDDAEDFTFGRKWDRYYDESPDFNHNLYWSQKVC